MGVYWLSYKKPTWIDQIRDKQLRDESLGLRFQQIESGTTSEFGLNSDGLKREVTEFVARCLTCQQVKVEYQLPSGLLQPVKISLWKLERVMMDFISRLPLTPTKNDSVWKLAKLYISEIVRLHGVLVLIISDRDPRFMSQFWNWEDYLRLAEFAYNKSFQAKDKVQLFRDCLKVASDRKKSYAHLKRQEIEYSMEEFVFLQMLKRYRSDPSYRVSVEDIAVRLDLTFEEKSVQIPEQDVKVLRRKSIPLMKWAYI
ncbi:uncharacterized protein LOC128296641 [Gossypium arboreum]|uniref:uncharacterized protein LOC128296641 n=1 Tax=Gossypium arboreum TaxID=29729 RepID=UPI0022F1B43F|nr:uncharacterized protein LOC128296641 [Gossypium arboreum]